MPIEQTPITYYLISYGADGVERHEGDVLLSDEVVHQVAQQRVTDVILLSHGWNADLPAARSQYSRWLQAMLENREDQRALSATTDGFRPLVVGLHWPSKAWGDEELGGSSFSASSTAPTVERPLTLDDLVDDYASRLANTPATRDALRTIMESALEDIAPPRLPLEVRVAYEVLEAEAGLPAHGEGAEPGADREPFDPDAVYQAARTEEQLTPYGTGTALGGLLAPLRTLTFWTMKRRALHFGESGAADLLRRLQGSVPSERPPRFHLVGHSFGCIVVSACITGGPSGRPTTVDSLALLQGALSLWSYCSGIPVRPTRSGYFHRLVADGLVRGPVVVSLSEHDRAVGAFYPLGARITRDVDFVPGRLPEYGGIGTFGARGPLPAVRDLTIDDLQGSPVLGPGVVHNVDCSSVIAIGDGPSGAHSDICHPEVAHLVWAAIEAGISVDV